MRRQKENEDVRILGTGQICIYTRFFTIPHTEVYHSLPHLLFIIPLKRNNFCCEMEGGGGKARDPGLLLPSEFRNSATRIKADPQP